MERLIVLGAILLLALCAIFASWALRNWALGLDMQGIYWMIVSFLSGAVSSQLLRTRESG